MYISLIENRQRGRFAGFSLYVSTTGEIEGSTLCYKDGPQLPPLNFTAICAEHGRYVIVYNERHNEVIYPEGYELIAVVTELCEVVVQGKVVHISNNSDRTVSYISWLIFKKIILALISSYNIVHFKRS